MEYFTQSSVPKSLRSVMLAVLTGVIVVEKLEAKTEPAAVTQNATATIERRSLDIGVIFLRFGETVRSVECTWGALEIWDVRSPEASSRTAASFAGMR